MSIAAFVAAGAGPVVAAIAAAASVTDWYEPGQKPARTGVYEIEMDGHTGFRYFDGENWWFGAETPVKAMYYFQSLGIIVNDGLRWRGRTEQSV